MAELDKNLGFAVAFVCKLHEKQNRKTFRFPYSVHLYEVMRLLQECKEYEDKLGLAKVDDDVLIAGLLHDATEDCGFENKDIEVIFGKKVASIVGTLTEDKNLPYVERKEKLIQNVANSSRETKLVKCADNLSNLKDIALNSQIKDVWKSFHADPQTVMKIQGEAVAALAELEGNPIYEELKKFYEKACESAQKYQLNAKEKGEK